MREMLLDAVPPGFVLGGGLKRLLCGGLWHFVEVPPGFVLGGGLKPDRAGPQQCQGAGFRPASCWAVD